MAIPKPRVEQPYDRRTGVFEILTMSPKLREMIAERKPVYQLAQQAELDGMFSFRHAALVHVAKGTTSLDEVRRVFPDSFGQMP